MGSSSSPAAHNQVIGVAVAATAAGTILLAGIVFYFYHRFTMARLQQRDKANRSFRREEAVESHQEIRQEGGNLKGLIVDENGVNVIYLRKLEDGQQRPDFSKIWTNPMEEEEREEEKRVDLSGSKTKTSDESFKEIPLLHVPSNTGGLAKMEESVPHVPNSPPVMSKVQEKALSQPQPPPPTPPPPTRPASTKGILRPPPTSPVPLNSTKKDPTPPPAPPRAGGLASLLKPPPGSRGKSSSTDKAEAPLGGIVNTQMKLKPLHWDKVTASGDHSVVWDEINDGSFR